MSFKNLTCLFSSVAIIGLMAGCASRPQFTAQQESSSYLYRARGNYRAPGPRSDPWGPYIREAAAKYDVPESWIRAVMHQESGGHLYSHNGDLITSSAGAMGLMQLMPATYDDLRGRYSELGDDPYDPHNNIRAGAAYLREMYDIYGSPGFLAAYNAGPGRLDDYLTRNRTLPAETRRYVAAIGPRIAGYEPHRPSPGALYAMNAVPLDIPAGPRYPQYDVQMASTVPVPEEAGRPIRLSRPVEVAEAPRPFIRLNPPAWRPPEPVAVAQAEPARPYFAPERISGFRLADASPPVREQAPYREEERSRSVLGAAHDYGAREARELSIPEPPSPPRFRDSEFARRGSGANRPIEVAEFPDPPRPPSQRARAASELIALGPRPHSFGLISSAHAASLRDLPVIASKGGAWAVQVGAFANERVARSATAAAREHASTALARAHAVVASVHEHGGTLYRARLGGLSHDAAARACERLSRARTNCMVVSPEGLR